LIFGLEIRNLTKLDRFWDDHYMTSQDNNYRTYGSYRDKWLASQKDHDRKEGHTEDERHYDSRGNTLPSLRPVEALDQRPELPTHPSTG
jgi:hypothetical protein